MQISALDIELTQRCNLACPYCYLGRCKSTGTIARETLAAAADLLDKQPPPQPKKKALKVNFYGGEPFLAFAELRWLVEETQRRGKNYRFTILSNGTLADPEIVAFCRAQQISVQRSLDGGPAAMRICRGEGTLEKYLAASRVWKDYAKTRRSTVLPETAKFLLGSLRYFEKIGFRAGVSPMPDYYSQWSPRQIAEFKENLWGIAEHLIARIRAGGEPFYVHWFDRSAACFRAGKNYRSQVGCGAGKGLWCLCWDGFLFLCHRFASEPRDGPFCVGSIAEVLAGTARGLAPSVQGDLQRFWKKDRLPRCADCIGQYGCTQGCYHSNWKCTGDLREPPPLYCELKRESAKIVQYIDNQLRGLRPDWWKRRRGKSANGQGSGNQARLGPASPPLPPKGPAPA